MVKVCPTKVCHFFTGMFMVCCLSSNFISYIHSFDFICHVQTFVEEFDSSLFSDHTVY